MTKHIGRLQAIGFGKESTAGTAVAATFWAPKESGQMTPEYTMEEDNSAYNTIDEVFDVVKTKETAKVTLNTTIRDEAFGNVLLAAFGTETLLYCMTLAGVSGGTPARGDVISSSAGSWAGVIKKVLIFGGTTYYFCSLTSGTFSNQTDVTNGTWTGGDNVMKAGVYGHYFTRLNTNNHPSFTAYAHDPVSDERAAYVMLDKLEMNFKVGSYARFKSEWKGKAMASTSAQTPTYASENRFLTAHARVYFAASESALNAVSTGESLQSFNLTIMKNLIDVQSFESAFDVESLHNRQFRAAGNLEALYEDTTMRDYAADSEKKACRLLLSNTNASELLASSSIYPTIVIDLARIGFSEWSRGDDLNELVSQTLGFLGELSTSDAFTIEALLINDRATVY